MTSEIEKQFFEAFGIESKLKTFAIKRDWQGELTYPPIYEYPQITDSVLLELICKTKGLVITKDCNNVEQLKDGVLKVLINLAQVNNDIKFQVQELFKEDN